MLLTDSFWGITIMILFIKRLHNMIKLFEKSIDDNNNNTNLTKEMNKLRSVVKKLTILSITAVITTQFTICINLFGIDGDGISLYTDTVINSLCLIFSYSYFKQSYQRFCCLCNKCCKVYVEPQKN